MLRIALRLLGGGKGRVGREGGGERGRRRGEMAGSVGVWTVDLW